MTSTDMPSRIAMPCPFGSKGTLGTIDNTSSTNMNYPDGFPTIYGAPSSRSGKFVSRGEMNRLGNIATNDMFYQKCGGLNTFDIQLAHFIGGYPKGAVLDYLVGQKLYKIESLIDNNLNDPTGNGGTGTFSDVTAGSIDGISWRFLNQDEAEPEEEKYQYNIGSIDIPIFTPTYKIAAQTENSERWYHIDQYGVATICGIVTAPVSGYFTVAKGSLSATTTSMFTSYPTDAKTSTHVTCSSIYGYGVMAKNIDSSDDLTNIKLPSLLTNNDWFGVSGYNFGIMSLEGTTATSGTYTTTLQLTTKWDSTTGMFFAEKGSRVAICLICGLAQFPTTTASLFLETSVWKIYSSSTFSLRITKI